MIHLEKLMKTDRHIGKSFVLQKSFSDCGVACLNSVINYHGGITNYENLRILSGTGHQGTTLLGLFQAAKSLGFNVEGIHGDISYLRTLKTPAILHVVSSNNMLHYIVLYSSKDSQFLIGDPAIGIKWIKEEELVLIWKNCNLLTLVPDMERFIKKEEDTIKKWKWIFQLIKNDLDLLIIIFITGISISILGIAIAVFSQIFVDALIPSRSIHRIYISIGLISFLLIVKIIIGYIRQLIVIKQGIDINIRITGDFLTNLFLLPYQFFVSRKIGDMVSRLNDIERIQQAISYLFGELLVNFLVMTISLVVVFLYNNWIGFLIFLGVPLFGWVVYKHNVPIILGQREQMAAYATNESNYINTVENIQSIKSCKKEEHFTNIAISIFKNSQQKVYEIGKLGASIQFHSGLISLLLIVSTFVLASHQMLSGLMTTGAFFAVFSLITSILPSLTIIAFTIIQIQGARVAFDRMYEFASMKKESEERKVDDAIFLKEFSELKFEKLTFRYPGRSIILNEVSFEIKKGELITLFGDNGTGKSTMLNLIQRFYYPESGKILINSENINNLPISFYRSVIAAVPQNVTLLNDTLIANITLSDKKRNIEKAINILDKYELSQFFLKFPQGLLSIIGEGGIQISGGQKQLVGLSRALIQFPQLLLLDELTAHMDRYTEDFVLNLLIKLKCSMGILSVSHNLRSAAISDKIIILSNAKIYQIGTHEGLLKSDNLYSRAWKSFFKMHPSKLL